LYAEFMGVILAIECAYNNKNWKHLWVECDSKIVALALKSPQVIPWQLKNRWLSPWIFVFLISTRKVITALISLHLKGLLWLILLGDCSYDQ
jgi:hypothetical protein